MKAFKDAVRHASGVVRDPVLALRAELMRQGYSAKSFADKHRLNYNATALALQGAARPSARTLQALVKDFGGDEFSWRLLLWEVGRPRQRRAAPTPRAETLAGRTGKSRVG